MSEEDRERRPADDEQADHPGFAERTGVKADDEPRFERADEGDRVPQGGEHLGEAPLGEQADSDENPAAGQAATERFEDG